MLGGAGIAMFGMIVASGIRSLGKVSFEGNHNLMLVAISIGVAMIPIAAPNFYANFPAWAQIILNLASLSVVLWQYCLIYYLMLLIVVTKLKKWVVDKITKKNSVPWSRVLFSD